MCNKYKYLQSILLMVIFAGCVSTSVTPLTNKMYDPVHPDDVILYMDEDDIPGEYEKVAIMYAKGDYAWTDEGDLFRKVRKKAAGLGANGLLVRQIKEPGTGSKVAQALIGTEANRKAEVVAIFVLPPPDPPPARPARRLF